MWYSLHMTNKECKTCGNVLPISLFHKRTRARDGLQSRCKDCNRMQRNEYYKTAKGKSSNVAAGKRSRIQQRMWVYEYLSQNPCECGESDPRVLEFDHNDPSKKSFTIASKIGNVSWRALKEEVEKCTVRCANCHRRKTAVDQNWYEWDIVN